MTSNEISSEFFTTKYFIIVKQAKMSIAKPITMIEIHKMLNNEELTRPVKISHFDKKTNDNGIPDIINNNIEIRYL